MILIYLGFVALLGCVLVQCSRKRQTEEEKQLKKRWKALNKELRHMEADLKKCPRSSNKKKKCNVEERIWGYISFMRDKWMPVKKDEILNSPIGTRDEDKLRVAVEDEANKYYMPIIEKIKEKCKCHTDDKEMLEIYFKCFDRHTDNIRSTIEPPIYREVPCGPGITWVATYRAYSFDPVPHPDEFWKQCETRKDWIAGLEVLYSEGRRLLKKKRGEAPSVYEEKPVCDEPWNYVESKSTMNKPKTGSTNMESAENTKNGEEKKSTISKVASVKKEEKMVSESKEKEASTEKDKQSKMSKLGSVQKSASKEGSKSSTKV